VNYKLIIVGDGHLKENLEQLVQQNNLSGRVVFVGMKSHDELIPIMKSCDVFVRVAQYEGMGNAFIEAMAAGLPIVGTAVGGIVDFLKPGETGFFCESGKPETVAQAIIKYEDDIIKNQIIDSAKKYIQEKYSWDTIARDMNTLLTKE
jgi:glycosyltransferase involved in cell wall biosynthesis